MAKLSLEYFLVVFVAALGVLQLVAWRNRLWGLLFSSSRTLTILFSSVTLAGSLSWFLWGMGSRLTPGLEGAQQLETFIRAALGAVALTLVLSSIFRSHRFQARGYAGTGLEALKKMTYIQALGRALEANRKGRDVSPG